MLPLLDSENADRDIYGDGSTPVTCLTHTPSASNATLCQAVLFLGDGTKNLDGSGGDFEVTITVGGVVLATDPEYFQLTDETRCCYTTYNFLVPPNNAVLIKLLSPNAADVDVDVTAYLYDVFPVNVASGVVEANAVQISGSATAANNAEVVFDTDFATNYDSVNNVWVMSIVTSAALTKMVKQLINVTSFAKDTGVLTIMADDGTTPAYTRTRTDNTSTLDWTAIA